MTISSEPKDWEPTCMNNLKLLKENTKWVYSCISSMIPVVQKRSFKILKYTNVCYCVDKFNQSNSDLVTFSDFSFPKINFMRALIHVSLITIITYHRLDSIISFDGTVTETETSFTQEHLLHRPKMIHIITTITAITTTTDITPTRAYNAIWSCSCESFSFEKSLSAGSLQNIRKKIRFNQSTYLAR